MSSILIISLIIFVFLLLKKRNLMSYYLLLITPSLFWIVGSGTYSGQQSEINISIFPITFLGVIADIKNMKINRIEFLAECYSLFFGVMMLLVFKLYSLNNIKNALAGYFFIFFRSKTTLTFTIIFFIFSIYKCLFSVKTDITMYSNYSVLNGLYVKGQWDCFGAFSRIFIKYNYHEDILFYSFLYIIVFYSMLFVFFKNQTRFKSIIYSTVFIIFFPIVSVGNNLFNYKGETTKDTRAIVVYPLSHALNTTIISFYQDSRFEKEFKEQAINNYKSFHSKYDSLTKVKYYSLFQILAVLLLLPSILILKEEKNAE